MDAFIVGIVIGVVHFGGLWWTIHRAVRSPNPVIVAGSSYVVRTGLTLAGFYAVMDGEWIRLVALAAGFSLARLALARAGSGPEPSRIR